MSVDFAPLIVIVATSDVLAGVTGCSEGFPAEKVTPPDVDRLTVAAAFAARGAPTIRIAVAISLQSFIGIAFTGWKS